MKRVLVTGATGFLGKYVIEELLLQGCEVIAAVRNSDALLPNSVMIKQFDLSNINPQTNYFQYFECPDICMHLAWEGLPNYSSDFHVEVNLPRHSAFLKNLINNGLKNLSVTGTCLEYGLIEGQLNEGMKCKPVVPYAEAKLLLWEQLSELCKSKEVGLAWLRLFYMWGKGQSSTSLFPQLEAAIERGDEFFPMSGGEQVRDYLPVERMVEIMVAVSLHSTNPGIVNCCSGVPVKLKELVANFIESKHGKIKPQYGVYPYPKYEPMTFWGDTTKMNSILERYESS